MSVRWYRLPHRTLPTSRLHFSSASPSVGAAQTTIATRPPAVTIRPSFEADLMLDTTFESAEALKGYSVHPAHVAVADGKVRPYTKARFCLDYEI